MTFPTPCGNWKQELLEPGVTSGGAARGRGSDVFVKERERTMRPTTANDNVLDFNNVLGFHALLRPPMMFEAPTDVVNHPGLTTAEKRAILASWASDASAIASCPSMRAPAALRTPASIDEILDALRALDDGPRTPPGGKPYRLRSTDRAMAA